MLRSSGNWRDWPAAAKVEMLNRLRERQTPVDHSQYRADPVLFAREQLGSQLTAGQVEILESVRDFEVTVVQSANGVGKTFCAADVGLWFLRCFEGAQVYTTAAPPLENLERLLWGEIEAKLVERPDLFGGIRPGYLKLALGPKNFLVGVAIPNSGTSAQREAKFAGKHAPYLLFIVDEGDAVPEEVYRGIESCMSGGRVRLLVLFNPREASGPVYRLIKGGAHLVILDAFSHPNVVTGRNVVPGAVDREKTVRRIAEWSRAWVEGDEIGPDDVEWFQVPAFLHGARARRKDGTWTAPLIGGEWRKVVNPALSYMTLARFPGQAENQLINRAWVEAAQQRWLAWQVEHGEQPPEGIRPVHGQDVAEFGTDRNVSCFRYGGWVAPFEGWTGVDVLVTADRAAELAWERGARASFVDATGVGSGVAPGMVRWWKKNGCGSVGVGKYGGVGVWKGRAVGVKVAEAPTEDMEEGEGEFGILRDQLWWACREWLRTDPGAMLPPGDELADELCAPKYRVRRGKIRVDDKDKLRAALGRSPDLADALCLTFAPEPAEERAVGESRVVSARGVLG